MNLIDDLGFCKSSFASNQVFYKQIGRHHPAHNNEYNGN